MSLPFGHPAEETSRLDPAREVFEESANALRVADEVAQQARLSQARLALMLANKGSDRHATDPNQVKGNVARHGRFARTLRTLLGPTEPRDPQSKGHKPRHRGYSRRSI